MSNISNGRIDDVAPGDLITVENGSEQTQAAKVVFKDFDDQTAVFTITFEGEDGETFQRDVPAGTVVTHAMQSKWDSGESPTPHNPDAPA